MKRHSIVPFLMQALEYLLWASMCMESSVPLLSIRYLTWRATLYTAVCQCYCDCQAGVHGEVGYFSGFPGGTSAKEPAWRCRRRKR